MNAIVMYLFIMFKNFLSFFTNMCTRTSSKSDSDISSPCKDVTTKNEINFKEFSYKWKISDYLNKSLYYSTNSLKLILCKNCNYNITTKHWHCFSDDIYCHTCYYEIPLVKKMMI